MSADKQFGNNHGSDDVAAGGAKEASTDLIDVELERMRERIQRIEEEMVESEILKKMNNTFSVTFTAASEADSRSIWVGNVDYGATLNDLEKNFEKCGVIRRIKILRDKFTGKPKGFAYIEFSDIMSIELAVKLNDSLFRGRQIKVTAKRTNIHGMSTTDRKPIGRGIRSRGGRMSGRGHYFNTAQNIPTFVPYVEHQQQYPAYRGRDNNRGKSRYRPY